MKETEFQSMLVRVIIADGGQAMKLSPEFSNGTVDLPCKMRRHPASFLLEAKSKTLRASTVANPDFKFKLDVTKLQQYCLRDWYNAGMPTGVVSLLQTEGKNINHARVAFYGYQGCVDLDWHAKIRDHVPLGDHNIRDTRLVSELESFINCWPNGWNNGC